MSYGKKIYDRAREELDRRRHTAEEAAQEKLNHFYAVCPQAAQVKAQIASNAAGAAKAVLRGGDAANEMARLRDRARELNAEYDRLLSEQGLTRRDVTPRYACEKCRDTGFADGRMCTCLKQLQRSLAYEGLCAETPLERSTFENFSLDYYRGDDRARRRMEVILQSCKKYAEQFGPGSPSLLFKGGTGLGKTHLSLAIAGKVIERGYGVIYGPVQSFAVALEKERFDRDDGEGGTNAQLLSCDLLILDDLGTEFPSNYVNAALYNVINARLLAGRPTLISTNLSMKELEDRYSERLASRIAGEYGKLEFLGSDVRVEMQKRRAAGNQPRPAAT